MNSREKNKKIAAETLEIGSVDLYETSDGEIYEVEIKKIETKIYQSSWSSLESLVAKKVTFLCVPTTSLKVAKDFENVCVLNFASARNPGGGWLNGADAQEESNARKTTLYYSLINAKDFYLENGKANLMYTDAIVYSKNVAVIRDENDVLCPVWKTSFITCAAPNLTGYKEKKLPEELFLNRMKKVLQVAALNGHEKLVLGAWGTGVFGWPTKTVAELFVKAIQETPCLDTVIFPIPDEEKRNIFIQTILENS